jgi:hypothetical protein
VEVVGLQCRLLWLKRESSALQRNCLLSKVRQAAIRLAFEAVNRAGAKAC